MHRHFILSDPMQIFEEGIYAVSTLSDDMRIVVLSEYIMQSIFLKITGYQEQKCKLILWDLAGIDEDLRHKLMSGRNKIGEASSFSDKQKVFKIMVNFYKGLENKKLNFDAESRKILIKDLFNKYSTMVSNSIFAILWSRQFGEFKEYGQVCIKNHNTYLDEILMCGNDQIRISADQTYQHRNRCAHNLLSYQPNVPTLAQRVADVHGTDNYFCMIFNLLLIDKAFTTLYQRILEGL